MIAADMTSVTAAKSIIPCLRLLAAAMRGTRAVAAAAAAR